MEEEIVRVRHPRGKEVLGIIESMLGAGKLRVICHDGKTRIVRIPGKMRKRRWMRQGDAIIVKPWDVQTDERGDVVWVYTKTQAGWLRRKGILKI